MDSISSSFVMVATIHLNSWLNLVDFFVYIQIRVRSVNLATIFFHSADWSSMHIFRYAAKDGVEVLPDGAVGVQSAP